MFWGNDSHPDSKLKYKIHTDFVRTSCGHLSAFTGDAIATPSCGRTDHHSNMAQRHTSLTFPEKPINLEIGAELNRGAWGAVYNGELEGRPVAVKRIHELLHQGGGEEERRKLFEDFREECKKLQSLSHPHVVGKWNHIRGTYQGNYL